MQNIINKIIAFFSRKQKSWPTPKSWQLASDLMHGSLRKETLTEIEAILKRLDSYHPMSDTLEAYAKKHNIPYINLPMADAQGTDLRGLPSLRANWFDPEESEFKEDCRRALASKPAIDKFIEGSGTIEKFYNQDPFMQFVRLHENLSF